MVPLCEAVLLLFDVVVGHSANLTMPANCLDLHKPSDVTLLLLLGAPGIQVLSHGRANISSHLHGEMVTRTEARSTAVVSGHDMLKLAIPGQHLSDVLPLWIEGVWVREHLGVPVGSRYHHGDRLICGERYLVPLEHPCVCLPDCRRELLHCPIRPHKLMQVRARIFAEHHHVLIVLELRLHTLGCHISRPQEASEERGINHRTEHHVFQRAGLSCQNLLKGRELRLLDQLHQFLRRGRSPRKGHRRLL
mmetsp:Transcript_126682/g.301002  ORF Transcript_126682/g.301002 Transcript_126682/m.301002 type:complete len:249 (+) Transcript_126682:463-1209(+)